MQDVNYFVTVIVGTYPGDANVDLVFNSADMVRVFVAGEYEDQVPLNSGWDEGDWNCDREFTSSDMVVAFQTGAYEAAEAGRSRRVAACDEEPEAENGSDRHSTAVELTPIAFAANLAARRSADVGLQHRDRLFERYEADGLAAPSVIEFHGFRPLAAAGRGKA